MICPKCGENNSDNFRFCGMCGTLLEVRTEVRRPAGTPVPGLPPNLTKAASAPEPQRPLVAENATLPASKQVPPISGPSMLGLNTPDTDRLDRSQSSSNQPSPHQPSMDALRERAFSGVDSFFEPEQPKTGGRRFLLLVAMLVALGGAGWWTYTNYRGAAESPKPEATSPSAGEAPAQKPSTQPAAQNAVPALEAGAPQPAVSSPATPSAQVPQDQSGNASASSEPIPNTTDTMAKPAAKAEPATPKALAKTPAKLARAERSAEKRAAQREAHAASAKAPNLPEPAAADSGDADFRKGEAYLYGRGAPKNCDQAVKYLKAASAKSNAKARSAFGTMYATGHCVPRDLPTSYLWFAMALRADPNNQILEKDLSAIWNQMTPPERQMATRMKQ